MLGHAHKRGNDVILEHLLFRLHFQNPLSSAWMQQMDSLRIFYENSMDKQ